MRPMNENASIALESPQVSALAQAGWIAGFAALTALAARVEIPHEPVPYTLQTMAVMLAGAFLGWRNGAISQLVYLLAGTAGLPVFALGFAGPAVLLGPTGGYLLAFPIAAAVIGLLVHHSQRLAWIALSMVAGLLIILASGTLHLWAWYIHDFGAAVLTGFFTFSWWDAIKVGAAAMMYREFAKRWPILR